MGLAHGEPIRVVAAENFYGDLAAQVGGEWVTATSLIDNPSQDPHLFEASAAAAKLVARAQVAIVNGADYDPWMVKLMRASERTVRRAIFVDALVGKKPGDNPHLWYSAATMAAVAKALAADLAEIDPAHRGAFADGAAAFERSLAPLNAKIAAMRQAYAGVAVIASEPVFDIMAQAIGLRMQGGKFALAVMNNAEPGASEVADFEDQLKGRKVKAMLYNAQASEPAVERLLQIARAAHVPVVGVAETEPAGQNYQRWMLGQLEALDAALKAAP